MSKEIKKTETEQCTIPEAKRVHVSWIGHSSTEHKKYMVWDDLFGILAWKFKQTKSGDMYLEGEKVYNELKDKFDLKRK